MVVQSSLRERSGLALTESMYRRRISIAPPWADTDTRSFTA